MPHFSIVVLHGFTSWLVPWAYPKVSIVPWWLCSEPFLSTFHWQCSAPLLKDMRCATSTWITFPSQVLGWLKPSRFEATIWPICHPWLREPRSIVVQPWEIEKRHKAPHWVLFRSHRLYPDRTSSNVKEVYLPIDGKLCGSVLWTISTHQPQCRSSTLRKAPSRRKLAGARLQNAIVTKVPGSLPCANFQRKHSSIFLTWEKVSKEIMWPPSVLPVRLYQEWFQILIPFPKKLSDTQMVRCDPGVLKNVGAVALKTILDQRLSTGIAKFCSALGVPNLKKPRSKQVFRAPLIQRLNILNLETAHSLNPDKHPPKKKHNTYLFALPKKEGMSLDQPLIFVKGPKARDMPYASQRFHRT